MPADRQYTFIQRLAIVDKNGNKQYILPDSVISADITEHSNMNGTLLILKLNDPATEYRDNLKVKFGAILEVTYGCVINKNDDLVIDSFFIMPSQSENGTLTIEAIQVDCYKLKKPAQRPQFFVEQSPASILKQLIKNKPIVVDCPNGIGTYHLNVGGNASRLIRTMARDYGCLAYYSRGTFYFVSIKSAMDKKSNIILENGNANAKYPILNYKIHDSLFMFDSMLKRKFIRWSTTAGMEESTNSHDNGTVIITAANKPALTNQGRTIIPTATVDTAGYGGFKSGLSCQLVLRVNQAEKELDETLKERQLIDSVTHHVKGNQYICRLKLGVCDE
ncbi:hypothetical protein VXS06_14485 [Photobacterium toruni]|uniref:Phage late control gene D protein (GPD) n=1 Tax=Photobacterium toruni TaxID=1935446 RepID=A0ABU6L8S2_9GAMM|nr:hypothetical protein [Photobacterium toruni]